MVIKITSLNLKLIRDIWKIGGQCIAISLVVGCGIGLMIATFGTINTLENSLYAFYEKTRFSDVFGNVRRAPDSLIEDIQKIPGVSIAETRIHGWSTLDLPDMAEPVNAQLISLPENGKPLLNGLEITEGTYPNDERFDEVIISDSFAKSHNLKPGDIINTVINGNKKQIVVKGLTLSPEFIYALGPGMMMPDDKRFGVIFMSRKALASAFDYEGAWNFVSVRIQKGFPEEEVIEKLNIIMKPFGGTGSYKRKFNVSHFFLNNEIEQLKISGTAVPPIFLLVAAFLLHLVVSRIITKEREQIGLLKAFGYRDIEIGWLYFKLILTILFMGFLFGNLLGFWMGKGMIAMYSEYFRFPLISFYVEPRIIIVACCVCLLSGMVGGFSAVKSAIDLSAAVAMAPPVPISYRKNFLTNLLSKYKISQPTKMVFRHVLRFPIRSSFSIIGISFAIGLMIMSIFFIDSVNSAIEKHFFMAKRQTMTVFFIERSDAKLENEIKRFPGVLKTEPVRVVEANIKKGHLRERRTIFGINKSADLNRTLDKNQLPTDPPIEGIALDRTIAKKLNASVGDLLEIEILSDSRPIADLPLVKLIDEQFGLNAYMSSEGLRRLMKEPLSVNAIHLMVDSRYANNLYKKLKETPAVGGIVQQKQALKSFEETMDKTMFALISFYTFLASLIAFGVVYNASRIALSERSTSLASLRILGFSQNEITYILLGELSIILFISLPIGCLFGYFMSLAVSPMLTTDLYNFPMVIDKSTYSISVLAVIFSSSICWINLRNKLTHLDLVSTLKVRD